MNNLYTTTLLMRKKYICGIISFLLLLPISGLTKEKKYIFGEIKGQNDYLVVNFELINFLNRDILNGLQKGLTAGIEYQLQLWKENQHWVDQLIAEKTFRVKVSFDNWERRYVLTTGEGKSIFLNEEMLKQRCSKLTNFRLSPLSKLKSGKRYRITVRVVLQPMSVENYQEVKRWLAGEIKELKPKALKPSRSPVKKAGNWLLGLVLNLTGFGDQVVTAKSPAFYWQNGSVILEKRN